MGSDFGDYGGEVGFEGSCVGDFGMPVEGYAEVFYGVGLGDGGGAEGVGGGAFGGFWYVKVLKCVSAK